MTEACPWCGKKALDVTCDGQTPRRYFCVGEPPHEWIEGDGPAPIEDTEDDQPEVSEDAIAERLADRVVEKLSQVKPAQPSLLKRLFG